MTKTLGRADGVISQIKYMWKYENFTDKNGDDLNVPGKYLPEAMIHFMLRMNYVIKIN